MMNRLLLFLAVALWVGLAAPASAQLFIGPPVGDEIASVNLKFGLLAPQTTFTDPSFGESSFANGAAFGLAASTWPLLNRRLGLRGHVVRSQTDGENATSAFAPI